MTAQIGMRPSATTEGNFPGSLQTGKFLDGSRVLMRCVTLMLAFIIVLFVCKTGPDVPFWLPRTSGVRQV